MNLDESVPPKFRTPFAPEEAGEKEIPRTSALIRPCENALSVTVGTIWPSETVPWVKAEGPTLMERVNTKFAYL